MDQDQQTPAPDHVDSESYAQQLSDMQNQGAPPTPEITHEPTEAEAADLGRPQSPVAADLAPATVEPSNPPAVLEHDDHLTVGGWAIRSGDDLTALLHELTQAGRRVFGMHNGLFIEKIV